LHQRFIKVYLSRIIKAKSIGLIGVVLFIFFPGSILKDIGYKIKKQKNGTCQKEEFIKILMVVLNDQKKDGK